MFGLNFTEMLFIAGLALILIGPKQLPEVARTLGRMLNELRRSTGGFAEQFKEQTKTFTDITQTLSAKDSWTLREAARKQLADGQLPPAKPSEEKKT